MIRTVKEMKIFDLIAFKCSLFGIFEVRGGIKASQSSIFNIKICMRFFSSLTFKSSSLTRQAVVGSQH